jgi:hypothetical protein
MKMLANCLPIAFACLGHVLLAVAGYIRPHNGCTLNRIIPGSFQSAALERR